MLKMFIVVEPKGQGQGRAQGYHMVPMWWVYSYVYRFVVTYDVRRKRLVRRRFLRKFAGLRPAAMPSLDKTMVRS